MEEHPEGYPRVAAFINSDKDTVLFRRFGGLHSRLLLYKEVELTQLETQLASLDRDDSLKDETRWRNHHSIHRDDGSQNEERKALVEKIEPKLLAYGKYGHSITIMIWECLGGSPQTFQTKTSQLFEPLFKLAHWTSAFISLVGPSLKHNI